MDYLSKSAAFVKILFIDGGPIVWLLLVLLLWGIYIIIVKSRQLNRQRLINPEVIDHIEKLLLDKRLPEATAFCKQHSLPMTRIVLAGIVNFDRSEAELKEILEEAGRQEVPGIRHHLSTLGTIAGIAPLLGLLGTVLGMIEVFATLSVGSNINANNLAGGISQALITTACGLAVAMPTMAFYNSLNNRATNLIIEMEKVSLHMAAILSRTR